jgi:hypothetical protein
MKLLTVQFSLIAYHFINPQSKYVFSSAPCSQIPSVYVFPLMPESTFYTHTELQEKNMFLYIIIFTCLDCRREDKKFLTECQ